MCWLQAAALRACLYKSSGVWARRLCIAHRPEMPSPATFSHLDDARISWFHIRAVLVAGVGFFADAYDVFVIGLALPMLYRAYYPPDSAAQAVSPFESAHRGIDSGLKISTSLGNLVGSCFSSSHAPTRST